MADVEVSIVTNSEKYVYSCIESLLETWCRRPEALRVHVVANPATMELIDRLRGQFPATQVWENREQRGFAENHNMIMEQATARFVLVLNDDVLFRPDALDRMLAFMEEHPDVGMVGPKLLNSDLTLQPSTYSFPTLLRAMLDVTGLRSFLDRLSLFPKVAGWLYRRPGSSRLWAHDQTCDVDTFRGACMLVQRGILDDVGLMDEVTLLYGEETEWCYRFWQSGARIVFLSEAEIIHFGKQSISTLPNVLVEVTKGYLNFFDKHGPRIRYHFFRLFLGITWGIKAIVELVRSGEVTRDTRQIVRISLRPGTVFAGKRRFYVREGNAV